MKLRPITTFTSNAVLSIRILVGFLLVAYSSVFLFSPGVMSHHDHDHVEHGIDTCEKDPCHITIYHHGFAGGCSHKYHFTKASETCPWCDVILAYQVSPLNAVFLFHDINFSSVPGIVIHGADVLTPFCHSGRDPPNSIAL